MPPVLVTARVQLTIGGRPVQLDLSMPNNHVTPRHMLPLFRKVAETVLDCSVQAEARAGRSVSCKKGCGACCRQMVPISQSEAHILADLVAAMPAERKQTILARFQNARQVLEQSGLLQELNDREHWPAGHTKDIGLRYFALGIPCPFLEDESCSIYPDRPITCREYLVSSPPEHCADPGPGKIRMIPLPAGPTWPAAARFDDPGAKKLPWVPLVLALEFASHDTAKAPRRNGPDWARDFISAITNGFIPEQP